MKLIFLSCLLFVMGCTSVSEDSGTKDCRKKEKGTSEKCETIEVDNSF